MHTLLLLLLAAGADASMQCNAAICIFHVGFQMEIGETIRSRYNQYCSAIILVLIFIPKLIPKLIRKSYPLHPILILNSNGQ